MSDKLDDDQVFDRLYAAILALGDEDGETTRGDTAIKSARRMLLLLQMGIIASQEGLTETPE